MKVVIEASRVHIKSLNHIYRRLDFAFMGRPYVVVQ